MHADRQLPEDTRYLGFWIGARELAIPQDQVRAVESVLDLHPQPAGSGGHCGYLDVAGERCPVYALDEDLALQPVPPSQRRVCILIEHEDACLGVLADRIAKLPDDELRLVPLPACMRGSTAPLATLAVKSDRVLIMTTAERLGSCLGTGKSVAATTKAGAE